jgi:hypothetical protein
MNVQELKPFESIRLTEGTGGDIMHVIKGENELFVTRNTEVKKLAPSKDENNQWVFEHFSKENGEKSDTLAVITNIRTTSHDWYSLLLCELIYKGLNHEKD